MKPVMFGRLMLLLLMLAAAGDAGPGGTRTPSRISCSDGGRGLWRVRDCATLREWRAQGRDHADLLIVGAADSPSDLEAFVWASGGAVRFKEARVGYWRVSLPIAAISALERRSEIAMLELVVRPDRSPMQPPQPAAEAARTEVSDWSTDAAAQVATAGGPYMPLADAGLSDRKSQAGAMLDGRGAVIAIVDTFLDPTHPTLAEALEADGARVPKVIGMLTSTDSDNRDNPFWVRFGEAFTAAAAQSFQGRIHRLPAPGRYRLGRFDFCPAAGRPCEDFTMLWRPGDGRVWIDGDRDRSFANERAIGDFRGTRDIATLTSSTRTSPLRVAVQTDAAAGAIHVHLVEAPHGTMVASTAAGSRAAGGLFDGVAPGARLLSIAIGDPGVFITIGDKIEGLLLAARHPEVDVINCSIVFGTPDGAISPVAQEVLSRIARVYGKPVVSGQADAGPDVLTVGMLTSRESFARNLRMIGETRDHVVESTLPSPRDGRLVPELVAPSSSLAATSDFRSSPQPARDAILSLPPGYTIGSGPSQAAPMVSGAIAVLASAARQTGQRAGALELISAIRTGQRWLPDFGIGALDIGGAWDALRRRAGAQQVSVSIDAEAREEGEGADMTAAVVIGPGVAVNRSTNSFRVRREGGSSLPLRFRTRWLGNDGSFATASVIELPLGLQVPLPVSIAPRRCGAEHATLQMVDPRTGSVVGQSNVRAITALGSRTCGRTERFTLGDHDQHSIYFRIAESDRQGVRIETEDGIEIALQTPAGRIHRLQPAAPGSDAFVWSDRQIGEHRSIDIDLRAPGLWRLAAARDPYPQLHAPPHIHRAASRKRVMVSLRPSVTTRPAAPDPPRPSP